MNQRGLLSLLLLVNISVTGVLLWKVTFIVGQIQDVKETVASTLAVASAIKTITVGGVVDKVFLVKSGFTSVAGNVHEYWKDWKK